MALHPSLQFFITEDSSPTLAFTRSDGYIEKMHHSGGALTESLYIYHHGLITGLDSDIPPTVVSVGLGLAYNELIALAEFKKRGLKGKIWSFEIMPYLREKFATWAHGGNTDPDEYDTILNQVCSMIEEKMEVDGLRKHAQQALEDGGLELRASFPHDSAGVCNVGVIFYDAFSNKMSPELWQEIEMQTTLENMFFSRALICTYARTGAMKRVLKNLGFTQQPRTGFKGKRESTLATRGF